MYERNSNIGDVFHHNYVGLDCWLNSPIYTLNRYLSMGRDRTSLYRYICIHFFMWCKPLVVVLQFLGKHSITILYILFIIYGLIILFLLQFQLQHQFVLSLLRN